MTTNNQSVGSSRVKNSGGLSVAAACHNSMTGTNGIVTEQARASDAFIATIFNSNEQTEYGQGNVLARSGIRGIHTRQIAVLIEHGVNYASLHALSAVLTEAGAVVHFVGPRVGLFAGKDGEKIEATKSIENSPAVLFDALIVPDGSEAIRAIAGNGHGVEFIKDLFRYGKTILALGDGRQLLEMAGIGSLVEEDEGVLLADGTKAAGIASTFIDALLIHRHPCRAASY